LTILTQCTQDIDLDFPNAPEQLVLNGILCPDSLIRIHLTKSLPVVDSGDVFPAVEEATVLLYEDDIFLDYLTFDEDAYVINYYPVPGRRYTVEVQANGYPALTASDTMPQAVSAAACYKQQDWYDYNTMAVQTTINDKQEEKNRYWLGLLIDQYELIDFDLWVECRRSNDYDYDKCPRYDSSTVITTKPGHMVSYSVLPDIFNSIVDNTSGGVREYNDYIRIDDASVDGTTFALEFTGSDPLYTYQELLELDSNQSMTLQLVNASQAYDRYLKSSIIYYYNNEFFDEPNPFAEPVKIYSNVENGAGIFAAYNSTTLTVSDFPCP
jgi:hypothetical protein